MMIGMTDRRTATGWEQPEPRDAPRDPSASEESAEIRSDRALMADLDEARAAIEAGTTTELTELRQR